MREGGDGTNDLLNTQTSLYGKWAKGACGGGGRAGGEEMGRVLIASGTYPVSCMVSPALCTMPMLHAMHNTTTLFACVMSADMVVFRPVKMKRFPGFTKTEMAEVSHIGYGNMKKENQDRTLLIPSFAGNPTMCLAAVFDGHGQHGKEGKGKGKAGRREGGKTGRREGG